MKNSSQNPQTTMKRDISTITVKEVDTAIRVLAAESPDFVYNTRMRGAGCFYHKEVLGGEPNKGCIFGQAFRRLGVDMDTIGGDDISSLWSETHDVTNPLGGNCPEEWQEVQNIQDNGGTWDEAIKSLPPVGQHTA